ncbi:hypothetical protein BGZ99_000257 [Dissophora globulifera]|uniref:Uncharacterized protein n=1 Tax=Dissophora globulifera TaxID=979702 RepID=A0A9P6R3P6_9FUNG|nr:hypothetical protein BGZ99_000257 [Dissophora globulifera]
MKRLELKMVRTDDMQGQYRLVLQCPNLEHLAWTPTLAITYQLLLFHLVTLSDEQTPCRIVSVDLTGTDVSDGELASLLNCLHKLQRLIVPWSSFGEKSCQQVVWFLRDTLEELDVRSCSALTTGMLQLVLMTCGKLKRLKAQSFCASILEKRTQDLHTLSNGVRIPLDDINNDGYDGGMTLQLLASLNDSDQFQTSPAILDSIQSWTWACTGLEELELDVHGLGSSSDTIVSTFLTQLSALISLQRLVLSWSSSESHAHEASLDLTLRGGGDGGGLAKLKTLTRLRHYDVQNVNLLRMDVDDFRWIGTHWTSLRTVRTAWVDYEDVETKSKIQHLLRTEFPHVALVY